MKNIFLFLIFFAVSQTEAFTQSSGTTEPLWSVYFTDANTGYAVGNNGKMVKTTDGGTSWIELSRVTNNYLFSVFFINPTTGWAVGSNCTILKTKDGGNTWTLQQAYWAGDHYYSVYFTDASTGYVTSLGGNILKTTNGGNTWNYLMVPGKPILFSIFFVNTNTGYAVGGASIANMPEKINILKTTNGGATWSATYTGIQEGILRAVYFTDVNTGYAVGSKDNGTALILKTTDGGSTWNEQNSPTTYSLRSVFFIDANTGFCCGDYGTLLKTTDGGNNWISVTQPGGDQQGIYSVYFINSDLGWKVGSSGTSTTVNSAASMPIVNTTGISYINTNSAMSGGNIISQGNAVITARGVCWSTSENPTVNDSKTTDGYYWGYSSSISGLTANTTYYVRAYAINSAGTAYGNQIIFTTRTTGTLAFLSTVMAYNITSTTATSGGNISSDGGTTIISHGICWSTSQNPTTSDNKINYGTGTGSFTSIITGLNPSTTYYVRAYATNSAGTSYGNLVSFTSTIAGIPTIGTYFITYITDSTATSGGDITSDGGSTIIARGVCWSTSQNSTISDNKTTDGNGIGSFNSHLTGLIVNTKYYYRAYATNSIGTAYGYEPSFTAKKILTNPSLVTHNASSITAISANVEGYIYYDGGATITACGLCWSTSQNPDTSDNKTNNGPGLWTYTSSITGLNPNTTYYARAYATNGAGFVGYGNQISFVTLTANLPSLNTYTVSMITNSTARSGGNISSDGNSVITSRGVCWSTSQNPTTSDNKTSDVSGTGTYTSSLTGLTPNTTYYVRAYATNSAGTSYGSQVSFSTLAVVLATIFTNYTTSITLTTAVSGGNISSDGGSAITTRGICWSTLQNPTTGDNKTSDGIGTGIYTSSITGLTANTTYYVRAYAENSAGTSYGDQKSFITLKPDTAPSLTTSAVSAIDLTSASCGGYVIPLAGPPIIARGVCWGTSQNPTISDNKTSDGSGTGIFTSSITGLANSTTYYVRAYATNSVGTGYGNEVNFSTLPIITLPSISTTGPASITSTSGKCGGTIISYGSSAITSEGVCWSTSQNPTISDNKFVTNGSSFTITIGVLTANTTYYVKAFATNSAGTVYGDQVSFTTLPPTVPIFNTIYPYNINITTAQVQVVFTSDGGAPITSRGICWSTSQNPTTSDSIDHCGSGSGSYVANMDGLTGKTTYYVRAYATNNIGTAYGNQISFTTRPVFIPVILQTLPVTSITSTSANSGGDIFSNGDPMIFERGVCWSTSPHPTVFDNKTIASNIMSVSFICNISGLSPNTTYYLCAYEMNESGIFYGDVKSFTTASK